MTPAAVPNKLTRERLRRLIDMVRERTAPETPSAESTEFDWTRPHHFSPEHLASLDQFRRKTVDKITDTFESLCRGPFTVTAEPVEQYYASVLAAHVGANQQSDYFLVLNTADEIHCGYVNFTTDAAARLVTMMLRESEYVEMPDRRLSMLEESILMDITAAVIDSFMEVLQRFGGSSAIKDRTFIKGVWPLSFEGFNDLTCLRYRVQYQHGSLEITFTLLSTVLEPAAGFEMRSCKQPTQEELTERMMQNIHKVPITVTARLCSAVELDDVMSLGGRRAAAEEDPSRWNCCLMRKTFGAFPALSGDTSR